MRILIFFALCFLSTFLVPAQNVLELKNTQTGKTRILKPGAKLYFSAHDSTLIKGKIVQIKDTSVVIYCPDFEDSVPLMDIRLQDINVIKKPTTLHAVSRTVGSVLLPVGVYLFINGVLALSRQDDYKGSSTYDVGLTKSVTIIGGAFIAGGTIPFLIKPKVYNLKKDWSISVTRMK